MMTNDIESHMRELYDLDISDNTISRVTDKNSAYRERVAGKAVRGGLRRGLSGCHPLPCTQRRAYCKTGRVIAIGIDMSGKKDVLGMYVGQNESAKFWLSILNGLKNRNVEDILIACVDGLSGFPQAIKALYPRTEIQQCIIHQILNTTQFVSYKESSRRRLI